MVRLLRRRRRRRRRRHGPPRYALSCVQETEIEAPVEVVWQLVKNVADYPKVMRDTTRIEPLPDANDCRDIAVGTRYRQFVCHPRWRTRHELDFVVTHVGPIDTDNTDNNSHYCLKGATRHRGGDLTATQSVERILQVDGHLPCKERVRYIVTYAFIPSSLWGRLLVSFLFRYPLLAEGNYSARNTCSDIKAAAEQQTTANIKVLCEDPARGGESSTTTTIAHSHKEE